jgi:serine O-acetyltransferase
MTGRPFQDDLSRYGGIVPWSDRALWVIASYRLGRSILKIRNNLLRRLLLVPFLPFARAVETIARTTLPIFAEVGGGLRIASCGMIFIHSDVVIGRNCTLRRGVTIGNAKEGGPTPIIGDNVEIGAYAQILGGVHIGDGATIATMSVVLEDIPAEGVASGIPARIRTGDPAAGCLSERTTRSRREQAGCPPFDTSPLRVGGPQRL